MYLRSLELCGFKSFPDSTKLTFTKGISAVVGPNGSGKSNIADAMRWVLGEKSSRSLRGETMEDVIFSGTPYRKRASYAQVTLTIDNSDGALKTDAQTVSVSRKLFRNGDSEYQINGSQVRLKDINELFMDTGLGKDGYSIIGQGRIGEIVSNKAADRRQIFDEAAGITKFRVKKEETERELLKAEDNISRLNDILGELSARIEPLKKQCEKAKKFRELDSEKSGLEIALWSQRLGELLDAQNTSEQRLRVLEEQYADADKKIDELEERISEGFARAAMQQQRAEDIRKQIHDIELENSRSQADIAVMLNDIEHFKQRIIKLKEDAELAKDGGKRLSEMLSEQRKELEKLEERKRLIQTQTGECEQSVEAAEKQVREAENNAAEISERINELKMECTHAEFALENAKNTAAAARERVQLLEAQRSEQERSRDEQLKKAADIQKQLEQLEKQRGESQNKAAGLERLLDSRNQKAQRLNENYTQLDLKLRETRQRLGILNDLDNAMEGFAFSVKYIITAGAKGRLSGICGTVAQIISTKPQYSAAIETALGGALQNIAVTDENAAKRAIRLLKEENKGRATFLPLTSVKGKELEAPPKDEDGYIALASELAVCQPQYSALIKRLLGRTVVAEDIDSASAIAKKYRYAFRIVTLDGQIISADGSYTGGSLSKSTGLLSRKNEIRELEAAEKKLQAQTSELKAEQTKLAAEQRQLAAQLDGEREKLSQTDEAALRGSVELEKARELAAQLDGGEERIRESINELYTQTEQAQQTADKAAQSISDITARLAQAAEQLDMHKQEVTRCEQRRDERLTELSEFKIAQAEAAKDIDSCLADISRTEAEISSGENGESRIAAEIEECEKNIVSRNEQITAAEQSVSLTAERTAELEEQIKAAQAAQLSANEQAEGLRTQQRTEADHREKLSAESGRLSERIDGIKTEFDRLAAKLFDEYGLTRSEAGQRGGVEDTAAARRRLEELKGQIKSLGSVNLGAIEEYAEVSERYAFLNRQLEDVNTSRVGLQRLIDELTENMKCIFIESFEKISAKFSEIFTELFGGGKGTLSLSDPQDILGSGIEISIAPPGKVVKNIMSLSGGEKAFAAVCIYFAILTVRPSPFCLLDEIEAALDDVNVARFAAYLHKFTDKTQFIAITHRRGTMEEADVLYGVTMQESGVSKLIKMELNDEVPAEINS